MKITVEARVKAELNTVWGAWNNPEDIKKWNAASDDWYTTRSTVDLREGGNFSSRMEAKDGSAGFDFEGTYSRIVPKKMIEYRLGDGRDVKVEFTEGADGVLVRETFEAESEFDPEADKPQPVSALESWLNTWRGVGDVIVGMHAQGTTFQLQQYPEGWRANFYTTGIAHSIVTGSAYEPTSWRTTQRAAWEVLTKTDELA